MRLLLASKMGRRVGTLLLALAALVVLGIALLWPSGSESVSVAGIAGDTQRAEVVRSEQGPCPGAEQETCGTIDVELSEAAAEQPATATIELGSSAFAPEIAVGDTVRVAASEGAAGAAPTYGFVDFERRGSLLWLALGFAALVIVFGRMRGGLSLLGLLLSLVIIAAFIVPAIRDGSEPVLVAIVGSLAVMLVTISLAHGLGAKSAAAMLGTTASLILVALLALTFTELAHITGFSSEEATLIGSAGSISIQGLLLAGMVIGALGVLDDVTVSQASTVMALRSANPSLGLGDLYRRAIDVGRDHITATVNTLVLAYAGASLPILLIFSAGNIGLGEAINSEIVATEIVAMLVGSIGLIAAVPVTTGLAAVLAVRLPRETVAVEAEHGHAH
jgi:uncharacterized membrane protein